MITKSSSFSRIMILVGIILSLFIGYFGGYIVKNYEAISDPRVFFNMTSSIGTILSASIENFDLPLFFTFFIPPRVGL